jgi:hypothetical protein
MKPSPESLALTTELLNAIKGNDFTVADFASRIEAHVAEQTVGLRAAADAMAKAGEEFRKDVVDIAIGPGDLIQYVRKREETFRKALAAYRALSAERTAAKTVKPEAKV